MELPPDPIELLMQIEERFGVAVSDDEAERIRSVGDLHAFILARIPCARSGACVTSAAFHRLRRALGELLAVPRERVRPGARMEELVPAQERRRFWQECGDRLGLSLPPLRRPGWLHHVPVAAFLVIFDFSVAGGVILHDMGCPPALCGVLSAGGVVLAILVCWAGYRLTRPWATRIPPTCATVRETVYTLISRRPAAPLVADGARAGDKEVWGTLCAIVAAQMDVRPDALKPTTRFWERP
jgi:hypothetical protein